MLKKVLFCTLGLLVLMGCTTAAPTPVPPTATTAATATAAPTATSEPTPRPQSQLPPVNQLLQPRPSHPPPRPLPLTLANPTAWPQTSSLPMKKSGALPSRQTDKQLTSAVALAFPPIPQVPLWFLT